MNEEITMDSMEFDPVLYQKNITENTFTERTDEGKGEV